MSKFKQLLALSTRLLEQEDTITVLRSELLTAEDSRDRVGADLAEALRIAKDQNVRAEALAQGVSALRDRSEGDSAARDVLKAQGYEYVDGAWMNLKPAAPALDVTHAIARLKELGYTWTGQEWMKQVVEPSPLPQVAQVPTELPAPGESAPTTPPLAADLPPVMPDAPAAPVSPRLRRAKNNECVYCKDTGHYSRDCPSQEASRAEVLAEVVRCDNCSSSWHTSGNCPSVSIKGAK